MSFLKYQRENPEFLNNFLKYKRFIEGCAETTVNESYFDLRTLFRYIKLYLYDNEKINKITKEEFKKIEIKEITINDLSKMNEFKLEQYIVFLANVLENDVASRNKKLASMKRLYEYLETNNFIPSNPTKYIKTARISKRLPKYLSLDDSKKLLSKTINSDNKYKIRNYAITCIFLNCCIRVSELIKIDLNDLKIDSSEQTIRINGKGNKQRILYLNEAVCEAITRYLDIRPKLDKSNRDYNALFLSNRKKRISKRTVQTIIKNELQEVFEEEHKKYHTHTLRHSGVSLLYNLNDIDIFILKLILGHKSLSATEIYTHVSSKKLKNIMETCTISSIIERLEESNE